MFVTYCDQGCKLLYNLMKVLVDKRCSAEVFS